MKLATKYLGLDLKNPIIPSAGPLLKEIDHKKTVLIKLFYWGEEH